MTLKERVFFRACVGIGNCYGGAYGYWLAQQPETAPVVQVLLAFALLIAGNAISMGLLKDAIGLKGLET